MMQLEVQYLAQEHLAQVDTEGFFWNLKRCFFFFFGRPHTSLQDKKKNAFNSYGHIVCRALPIYMKNFVHHRSSVQSSEGELALV